jgi:hypothetical protein
MPSEEANDDGALATQLAGIDLDMISIEQAELRSAVADFQGHIFKARSFEFGGRAMHRFDGRARRLVRGAPDSNAFLKSFKRD